MSPGYLKNMHWNIIHPQKSFGIQPTGEKLENAGETQMDRENKTDPVQEQRGATERWHEGPSYCYTSDLGASQQH